MKINWLDQSSAEVVLMLNGFRLPVLDGENSIRGTVERGGTSPTYAVLVVMHPGFFHG